MNQSPKREIRLRDLRSATPTCLVLAIVLSVLLMASIPSRSEAVTINNPGQFSMTVNSGFFKIGSSFEETIEVLPDDPIIAGAVDADGEISAPVSGIQFGQFELTMDTVLYGVATYGIGVLPTAAATGEINPITGRMKLDLSLKVKVTMLSGSPSASVGPDCYIGSEVEPIRMVMNTATGKTPGTSSGLSLGGVPYDPLTGTARLADRTFAAPAQNGCTGFVGGQLNSKLGLPSRAGDNGAEFGLSLAPAPDSPPSVILTEVPRDPWARSIADFSFASNLPPGSGFECRLDTSAWDPCPGGTITYEGLETGTHEFEVRGTPDGGTTWYGDRYTWMVEIPVWPVRPQLRINPNPVGTGQPATLDASDSVVDGRVKPCLEPEASEPGCGYRWDLDGDGTVDQVTNDPILETSYPKAGYAGARVTVFNNAGKWGTAVAWVEVQETPVVRLDSGPPAITDQLESRFTFSIPANAYGSGTECSLDGGSFAPCRSGDLFLPVQAEKTSGAHAFEVRGITPDGIIGPPVHYAWTIDRRAVPEPRPARPTTTIATFDGTQLRLKVKCASKRVGCLAIKAFAVTGKSRGSRRMSSIARIGKLAGGRAHLVQAKVRPSFRSRVLEMAGTGGKSLLIKVKARVKKGSRTRRQVAYQAYRVVLAG